MRKKLFFIFTIASTLELILLIYVGNLIGLWYSLLIIILTATIGSYLIKKTGKEIMNKIQVALLRQEGISDSLLEGALLIFSGALLVTPGFLSDALALIIHIPLINGLVRKMIKKRLNLSFFQNNFNINNNSNAEFNKTIDLDDFYM